MSKIPQFGVPITPSEASLGLPFCPAYGVTPSNEYIPLQCDENGVLASNVVIEGITVSLGQIRIQDGSGAFLATVNSSGQLLTLSTVVQPTGTNLHTVVDSGSITATPPALPSSSSFGQTVIAATGTAVQLSSNPLVNGVVVSANTSNTASIIVGLSGVTNITNGSGNGYVLAPGASIGIAVANTNSLWINGTSGDVVSFVGS